MITIVSLIAISIITVVLLSVLPVSQGRTVFQAIGENICAKENPTLTCVFRNPELYTQDHGIPEVKVTGSFVRMNYHSSSLLTDKHQYPDPEGQVIYLSITLTDSSNESDLVAFLTEVGDSHPEIINHVHALRPRDEVTVTGTVSVVGYYKCWDRNSDTYKCHVGEINILSIDGIDKSAASVLPWDVPASKQTYWFLGEGLRQNSSLMYRIDYGDVILDKTDNTVTRQINNRSVEVSLLFRSPDSYNGEWPLEILMQNENGTLVADSCKFQEYSGHITCSKINISDPQNRPIYLGLFLLGEYANATHTKQLYPPMSRWAFTDSIDIDRRFIDVIYDDKVMINGQAINTTAVGWPAGAQAESDTLYWIKDGNPFPLECEVYSTLAPYKTQHYSFKLLRSENLSFESVVPVFKPVSNETLARFRSLSQGYPLNKTLDLDMSYVYRDDPKALAAAEAIQDAISSCDSHFVRIYYGLGSMSLAIQGKESENQNWPNFCVLAVISEIEMGGAASECLVPVDVMPSWTSWNNRLTPQFDEISRYCTNLGYFH